MMKLLTNLHQPIFLSAKAQVLGRAPLDRGRLVIMKFGIHLPLLWGRPGWGSWWWLEHGKALAAMTELRTASRNYLANCKGDMKAGELCSSLSNRAH
uniref:Uncharacterized protein n=1 Tax=Agaricus bisporus TaxID=5341 RepID=A0A1Q1M960_AGABI|nr:hypothetical protein [Agaricus bisporus]